MSPTPHRSPALADPFADLRAWLIDMDGVLYRGVEPLPAAAELLAALRNGNHPYLLLTNNATMTPAQFVAKLARMHIEAPEEAIFTSSLATASWLGQHYPPPRRVLVIGGDGIRAALATSGYERITTAEEAEVVVVGLDQQARYEQLAEAALAIQADKPWIATNPDRSVPSERGDLPGAGALLALLTAATGRQPFVIGKPAAGMFELALARLNVRPDETVMLGDRLDTDIVGGHRAGLHTICVLTGVSTQADAEACDPRPDWIISDLTALLDRR